MHKKLLALNPGDVVCYTGFDGIYRELTFLGINGMVDCVKRRPPTPNLQFTFNDKTYNVPLEAWLFTRMPYTVKEAS